MKNHLFKLPIIFLLAFCLLVPVAVEAHRANPLIAGLLMPTWLALDTLRYIENMARIGEAGWSLESLRRFMINEAAISVLVPGMGHFYSTSWKEGFVCLLFGFSGMVITGFGLSIGREGGGYGMFGCGISMLIWAYLFDILHAPIAAAKHNRRHEERTRSRPTIYPTLALGKNYIGAGIGVSF